MFVVAHEKAQVSRMADSPLRYPFLMGGSPRFSRSLSRSSLFRRPGLRDRDRRDDLRLSPLRPSERSRLRLRLLLFRSRERDLDLERDRDRDRLRLPRDRPPVEPQRLFLDTEWSSTIWKGKLRVTDCCIVSYEPLLEVVIGMKICF